jgi:hypothetical protein
MRRSVPAYSFGRPTPIVALQFRLRLNRALRPQVLHEERPRGLKRETKRVECTVCGELFKPWGDGMRVSKRCWVWLDNYQWDLEARESGVQLRLFRAAPNDSPRFPARSRRELTG